MTRVLWGHRDLSRALGIAVEPDVAVSGITMDSRTVRPGDMFVALRGGARDGHDFIHAARDAGASAILSETPDHGNSGTLFVPNTMKALQSLARYRRAQLDHACVIGITGSVGKTTIKDMLHHALRVQGLTYATEGNYNNHLGVPITLARTPLEASFVVVEMGMNHAGELTELTSLVQPDVALVSTIAPSHIGNFSGLSAIADAKAEIFSGLSHNGIAIIGTGHAYCDHLMAAAKQYTRYVYTTESFFRGVSDDRAYAACAACVLAIIHYAGADVAAAQRQLETFRRPSGRGNIVTLNNGARVIHDAYNASPVSMQAALERLQTFSGHTIAVVGDMLELGDYSKTYHQALVPELRKCHRVILVGPAMSALAPLVPGSKAYGRAEDVDYQPQKHDVVLLKGSASMGLRQIAERWLA